MANEAHREQPDADRTHVVRTHAALRRETTWERLKAAIERLEAEGRPVSVRTIQEVSGMEYNSYGRNAKARALFQQHSTALQQHPPAPAVDKQQPPRPSGSARTASDPARELTRLEREVRKLQATVGRLEAEVQRLHGIEAQYHLLLQERVTLEMQIARLEVELVKYRGYTRTIRQDAPDDHMN